MNWKRIIGGGLLAGLILNLGEFGIEPLMGAKIEEFFRRLGLPTPPESVMALLAIGAFVLGIIAVWLYAAIRPRYGSGASTAAIAGIAVWALSCLLPNATMYAFGLIGSASLFWLWTLWPLLESVVSTIVGAWIYREADEHRSASRSEVPVASR